MGFFAGKPCGESAGPGKHHRHAKQIEHLIGQNRYECGVILIGYFTLMKAHAEMVVHRYFGAP